jgi:membrane-bound lytic murein transglycosylase B
MLAQIGRGRSGWVLNDGAFMRAGILWVTAAAVLLPAGCGVAPADEPPVTPTPLATASSAQVSPMRTAPLPAGFARWIDRFRPRALAAGIEPATFDSAFASVEYLDDVIARDRTQAEFVKPIWEYLDSAVSETRIANGRAALATHRATLDRIEARFGVEKEVVVAIWGLESAYGAQRGGTPILSALATLAYDGRRAVFFEAELLAALRIIQAGDTAPGAMRGSWAGAMGHTQFMPSSFLAHAVDFGSDGRRDIWSDDPTDALASAAAYLAAAGWTRGAPWGVEIALPDGFDYAAARRGALRPVREWSAAGLRRVDGRALPDHGPAAVVLPAGARGPAFLVYSNFEVIARYNNAVAYVLGIGHLSDRLGGGAPFARAWPRGDAVLTTEQRQELQERLTRAGHDTGGIDGRLGPATAAAVRAYQARSGLVPDGYPTLDLLRRLRRATDP